jgi:hypothetical protein
MKHGLSVSLFALVLGVTASAQPIPPGQKVGLTPFLQGSYAGLKQDLTEAAEKMPEGDYGFKPSSMLEVRTYGQLFAHVAAAQFDACAAMKDVPNPSEGRKLEQQLETKAELMKALDDSFAFCDEVFASLTDTNVMDFVKRGKGEIVKTALLVGLLAHGAEMYGVSTVYLRARNLVPPSTERQSRRRDSGERRR